MPLPFLSMELNEVDIKLRQVFFLIKLSVYFVSASRRFVILKNELQFFSFLKDFLNYRKNYKVFDIVVVNINVNIVWDEILVYFPRLTHEILYALFFFCFSGNDRVVEPSYKFGADEKQV